MIGTSLAILCIVGLVTFVFEPQIDITTNQIILWYTPLKGGTREYKILYEKS